MTEQKENSDFSLAALIVWFEDWIERNEKKIYWRVVLGIFLYLAYCFLTFADHDENGTWFFPLIRLAPPVILTILLWKSGTPDLSKESIDDMPAAQRNTDDFTKKLITK